MKTQLSAAALLLWSILASQAVVAAPALTKTWNDCGGTGGFRFCAAAAITFEGTTGSVYLWNYSGLTGTHSLAASGLYMIALFGIAPITLNEVPVSRDPGSGFADGLGVFVGGTRVDAVGWTPTPPLTEGWLLYARETAYPGNPALDAFPQSLGAGAIGSACPGGWDFAQQGSGRFWQTPCAAPDLGNLNDPGWASFSFQMSEEVSDLTGAAVELCAYANGGASCLLDPVGAAADSVGVPEPSSLALLGAGLLGISASRRRFSNSCL